MDRIAYFFRLRNVAILVFACLCLPVYGAQLAANVILSKGLVTATSQDGQQRTLKRRSKVFSGDVIRTGGNGSVQLRFVDKALMTIKASSEMNISNYVLGSKDNNEQAIMRLVKGGFRTITGAIGKGDKTAYRVYTPAASVGIRGTNYEVQQEASGSFVMAVYTGGISVTNDAGSIDLGLGSGFNFTRVSAGEAPKGLLLAPASLNVNAADSQEEEEQEEQKAKTQTEENETSEEGTDESESTAAVEESSEAEDGEASSVATDVAILDDSASDGASEVNSALDKKLSEKISKTADDEPVVDTSTIFSSPFPPDYNSPDAALANPFPHTLLTDEEWNLLYSKQFAALDMQIHYSIGADGAPSFKTQLLSPNAVNVQNFFAFDYSGSGQDTYIDLNYSTLNTFTQVTTFHSPVLDINVNITSAQELADHLNIQLSSNSVPIEVLLVDDPSGQRFVFQPTDSGSDFITSMDLDFNSSGVPAQQLIAQLGGVSQYPTKDWKWSTNTYLNIVDGSWRVSNNTAIGGLISSSEGSSGEPSLTLSFAYVSTVQNPSGSENLVSSLSEFKQCASNNEICDIQIEEVAAANNIRWGAWFARPGNGITDSSVSSGTVHSFIDESNLRFGLLAERAELNQLTGEAVFSSFSHTDCTDYSQCVGFSDDGIVSSLTGKFDVDFNSGAITNGNLQIETMGQDNSVLSTWDVDFNGHIHVSEHGELHAPEFYTDNIGGIVSDAATGTTSNEVIGTVGGIFVKPGDIFAGGYNLATDDNTNKHATGVFTLEKE